MRMAAKRSSKVRAEGGCPAGRLVTTSRWATRSEVRLPPPPHDDGVEHVLEDQGCKDETEHEEDGAERHRGRNGRAARKVPHLDLAKCSL